MLYHIRKIVGLDREGLVNLYSEINFGKGENNIKLGGKKDFTKKDDTIQIEGESKNSFIPVLSMKQWNKLESMGMGIRDIEGKTIAQVKEMLAGDGDYIRLADSINKNTDATRGGTWYTNKKGADIVRENKEIIGGKNIYNLTSKPKRPLVIDDADLNSGATAIVLNGYEDFIPEKYSKILDNIVDEIKLDYSLNRDEVELKIMDFMYDAGISEEQSVEILKYNKDFVDAAIDAIASKGLKEAGYDGLILKSEDAEHIFKMPGENSILNRLKMSAKRIPQYKEEREYILKEYIEPRIKSLGNIGKDETIIFYTGDGENGQYVNTHPEEIWDYISPEPNLKPSNYKIEKIKTKYLVSTGEKAKDDIGYRLIKR